MSGRDFHLVVAADEAGGIGSEGDLPWRLAGDLKRFRDITKTAPPGRKNAVIMGRRTWESLPPRFRPLPGRLNIVLTRRLGFQVPPDTLKAATLDHAIDQATTREAHEIFIIGGAAVYVEALEHPRCGRVYLTRVRGRFGCDRFLPPLPARFVEQSVSEEHEENGIRYDFAVYAPAGEDGSDA